MDDDILETISQQNRLIEQVNAIAPVARVITQVPATTVRRRPHARIAPAGTQTAKDGSKSSK